MVSGVEHKPLGFADEILSNRRSSLLSPSEPGKEVRFDEARADAGVPAAGHLEERLGGSQMRRGRRMDTGGSVRHQCVCKGGATCHGRTHARRAKYTGTGGPPTARALREAPGQGRRPGPRRNQRRTSKANQSPSALIQNFVKRSVALPEVGRPLPSGKAHVDRRCRGRLPRCSVRPRLLDQGEGDRCLGGRAVMGGRARGDWHGR